MSDAQKSAQAVALKAEHPDWGYIKIGYEVGWDKDKVRRAIEHAERKAAKLPAVVIAQDGLDFYETASRALAQAKTVNEAKDGLDRSEAMRIYARRAKNYHLEADAFDIREGYERRLGSLLIAAKDAGQVSRGQPPKVDPKQEKNCAAPEQFSRVRLEDAGIDRKLSSRAQKKARIPDPVFAEMVSKTRADILSGHRIADTLKGSAQTVQQEQRRKLQRSLSDESAKLAVSGRKFPVLYADPATKFRAGIGNRSIENHYRTMSIDELCEMGEVVQARCLPNCHAYIWTTVPQLANTITRLLPTWGFHYSSCCVWDKTAPDHPNEQGTGLVFRNQHEILIYALRGKPPGPAIKPLSIYRERKREHSRKPDYFRGMIADMTGNLPVLEMFARVDAEHLLPVGWEPWGNEAGEEAA